METTNSSILGLLRDHGRENNNYYLREDLESKSPLMDS